MKGMDEASWVCIWLSTGELGFIENSTHMQGGLSIRGVDSASL